MTIAFPCESCGHRFEVDGSLAGKKCKCKKCNHVFVIPVPQTASASSSSQSLRSFGEMSPSAASKPKPKPQPKPKPDAAPTKAAAPAHDPYYSSDDPYGFDDEPVLSRAAPSAAEDEEFIPRQTVKPVAGKPRKKKKSGGSFFESVPGWAYLAGLGALAAAVISAFFIPAVAGVLIILALLASVVMLIAGSIGMLVVPFMESAVCGLMAIFVPFYGLYYVFSRWEAMRKWFGMYVVGMGVVFGGALLMPAIGAARQAAERARQQDMIARGMVVPGAQPGAPDPNAADAPPFPGPMRGFARRPGFVPPNVPRPPAAPANPAEVVTLNVSGLSDKDTADIFHEKLGELAKTFNNGNGGRRSHGNGDREVCVVWPINDVQAFANGITFARVTKVNGRTIDVVVTPPPAGERRPPDSDFVGQVLFDLKSPALNRRKDALRRLREAPPDPSRREEVSRAVEPMLKDPDGFGRADAAKALKVWGGPENTPALVAALNDPQFFVVGAALEALKALHDPAAAEAVAARLTEPGTRGGAAETLKAMGPEAQAEVVKYLNHSDVFVRMEACKVLEAIGTTDETRVAVMNVWYRANGHGLDAMAADDTIKRIGKPKPSPFKKKSIVPK